MSEQQVCIFCHTPHNASPTQPLWNRNVLPAAYKPYASNSLDAKPGQPTGSSKLCLSCHDGTIALGNVVSRDQPILMAGGMTTIPPGKSNIGTDLSDDHPISFKFDDVLLAKDPKLKDPRLLPNTVKLDHNGELQCTTCHEPHDNTRGKFLVMDNANSQLCKSCHNPGQTTVAGHDNCSSCHQPHTAPSGALLLTKATVSDTCTSCHGGGAQPAGSNVAADLQKFSKHDTNPSVALVSHVPTDVACNDCHGPHTMKTDAGTIAPLIPGTFGAVSGVNSQGALVNVAQYEYEVCFKCHSTNQARQPYVARQIVQTNARLEFADNAISFHPVVAPGRNNDVPSLRTGLTTGSRIYCSDCHSSDTGKKAGGTGPDGTHGSNNPPLLVAPYETRDNTPESATSYALCYKCHDRASILADESFKVHKKHVVDQQTPCAACHDGHGIAAGQGTATKNSHLINFETTIVKPDPVTNRLEFRDLGVRTGECFLSCHGKVHSSLKY
jgi:predicted CXXCH cytochrome family protein